MKPIEQIDRPISFALSRDEAQTVVNALESFSNNLAADARNESAIAAELGLCFALSSDLAQLLHHYDAFASARVGRTPEIPPWCNCKTVNCQDCIPF